MILNDLSNVLGVTNSNYETLGIDLMEIHV